VRLCFLLVLLEGWKEYQDKETGKPYYHHAATNHTQWDRPAVAAAPMAADAAAGPPPKMCGVGVVLVQVSGGAVCVNSVNKGGPAYNSGQIERGDVLYAIDGQKVPATSISCLLRWKHPGTSLTTGCHTGARLGRRAGEALHSGACGLADYYELPACRQPGCWQAIYRRDHDPSAR
jgi:hypothetical protein